MKERQRDFLSDLFKAVTDRSRKLLGLGAAEVGLLPASALAEALLSTRGEASGVALARMLLERWNGMAAEERRQWFELLARDFGPDSAAVNSAVAAWNEAPSPEAASALHKAAEPRRQELFRRINMAPGGTAALVKMREALLGEMKAVPELSVVDADFEHLFSSWFNRGFLLLRRIDWSTPADILERIIRYEAVHEIAGWDDLKGRLAPADRRCFAFFHPQMPDDPLVFVEVALTRGIPSAIGSLIAGTREPIGAAEADTAVFYSISNTQPGLRGVSFGNFLIKQVVEELVREMPNLKCFVTLSPVPGFASWLTSRNEDARMAPLVEKLSDPEWHASPEARSAVAPLLQQAAAAYFLTARGANGKPLDPVARFHLNNGAMLERINLDGDLSGKGLRQSHGVMVNYLYDLDAIERNHEAYAASGAVAASAAVKRLIGPEGAGGFGRSLQAMLPQRSNGRKDAS
jgi:malonyl-CoA decarboxylase